MAFVFEKHFTLEEANNLVPAIRELFRRVHAMMEPTPGEVAALKGETAPNGKNGHSNGHGKNGTTLSDSTLTGATPAQRIEAANELLKSVAAKGIVIQDWRRGLIDFPSIRDGEEVFLCYELADGSEIQFFHDLDAGYAGRQPL